MIIENINLVNFRNYSNLKIEFEKGLNFLYGPNATGKTSLVEAIYYLSLARSFRTSIDAHLIKHKCTRAQINAKLSAQEIKRTIDIELSTEGKKIFLNQKQIKKISELSNIVNVIYFIPKDVDLLKDSPKQRRLFLNLSISKVSKSYLEKVTSYEKLLKERNNVLKDVNVNIDLLDVLTEQMVYLSKDIYLYRKKYINELNEVLLDLYQKITNSTDKVKIIYTPFVDNEEKYLELARLEFSNSKDLDLKRKQTTKGIQKEDFYLIKNQRNIGTYGSQGENRLAIIALKLSPYELIHKEEDKPIVILDDILSELDDKHQKFLIEYISNLNQVFLTSTKKNEIENCVYYKIENESIVKENM